VRQLETRVSPAASSASIFLAKLHLSPSLLLAPLLPLLSPRTLARR